MVSSLFEMLQKSSVDYNEHNLFSIKKENDFVHVSYRDFYNKVLVLICGLKEIGIKKGDKIFLFCDNRIEWIMFDFALQGLGAISIPRGTDTVMPEVEFILEHSESDYLLIENVKANEKLKGLKTAIKKIAVENDIKDSDFYFDNIYKLGEDVYKKNAQFLENIIPQIKSDDVVTIIYTSGTTGNPKGVMLTHKNILHDIINALGTLSVSMEDITISVLPIWHIFERMVEYTMIYSGANIYYSTVKTFVNDVKKIKPTMIIVVPRILEAFYEKVNFNISKLEHSKKNIFNFFYKTSLIYFNLSTYIKKTVPLYKKTNTFLYISFFLSRFVFLPFYLIAKLLFKSIKDVLGGNVRVIISGGGSLPYHIDTFFNHIGFSLVDGYGMTENSPIICLRDPEKVVMGTSGKPISNIEVKIIKTDGTEAKPGEHGECLVKGDIVMKGYYKNEEATNKILKNGWFHTGDLVTRTYYGEIKVLGRIKDTIVLLGGENVEPEKIETHITKSVYISNAVVIGQNQKRLKALIVPDKDKIIELAATKNIVYENYESLINSTEIYEEIKREIDENVNSNPEFKTFEKIFEFRMIPKQFEVGDELTQSLKIKRHIIYEKYKHVIDDILKKK
jgi:long-chain acyl-CoA synthetase